MFSRRFQFLLILLSLLIGLHWLRAEALPLVDPVGLTYTPDSIFLANSGVVHLFSPAKKSIFRWDPVTQRYLSTIPLMGSPSLAAYSVELDTVFVADSDGLIRKIDLSAEGMVEEPFCQMNSAPQALITAGTRVLAKGFATTSDSNSLYGRYYLFAADGTGTVQAYSWPDVSQFAWSVANQKMYFISSSLMAGTMTDTLLGNPLAGPFYSPYYSTGPGYANPVLPSPDGSKIVLGSGAVHDGGTLDLLTPQVGRFLMGAWDTSRLFTVMSYSTYPADGSSSVASRDGASLAVERAEFFRGTALAILPLGGDRSCLIVQRFDGIPSFYVLDEDLKIEAPPVLERPVMVSGAIKTERSIEVTWRDISGEQSYRLERRTLPSGPWQVLDHGAAAPYIDQSVVFPNTYEYRVTGVYNERSSEPSVPMAVRFDVPLAPVLTAVPESPTGLLFSWENTGAASYALYYGYDPDRPDARRPLIYQPAGGAFTYRLADLSPGARYYFYLVTKNSLGYSAFSEPVEFLTPPSTPVLDEPEVAADLVNLHWSDLNSSTAGVTLRVERMTGGDGNWEILAMPYVSYFTDRTVESGIHYRYRITAINTAGEVTSVARDATTPARPLPEIDPVPVEARHGWGPSIVVRWYAGRYERSYRLERRTEDSGWSTITEIPARQEFGLDYADPTVEAETVYWYRVVYVNETGETISGEVRRRAAAVELFVTEDFEPGIDEAIWSDLRGAELIEDAENPANHVLRISNSAGSLIQLKPFDTSSGGWVRFKARVKGSAVGALALISGTDWSGAAVFAGYVDVSVTEGFSGWKTYEVEIPESVTSMTSATSISLSGEGEVSMEIDDIEVFAAVPRTPPPAVTDSGLEGFPLAEAGAFLTWRRVPEASCYVIERRTEGGPWARIRLVNNSGLYSAPMFLDRWLVAETEYFYRIIARNSGGDAEPSPEVSVTILSALESWRLLNYGQKENSGPAASLEDHGTGVVNLLKFAFNLRPQKPSPGDFVNPVIDVTEPSGMPEIWREADGGLLRVRYVRYKEELNPGVTYTVEFSDDFSNWETCGREVETEPSSGSYERVTWEDDALTAGVRAKRFARVRVTEE